MMDSKTFKNIIIRKVFFIFFILSYLIFSIYFYYFDEVDFYVTLTSWKGRINYIHTNLEILLNNSLKPKKIILNLSIEEFPKKNLELPVELINLEKKYNNFEIFWVNKNNNVFKKLIPTLNRYKDSLIITVDDDIIYPKNLFKKMFKCFRKEGGNNPMSFGQYYSDWNINGTIIHSHYGAGSIVSYKYFNNKIDEIYKYTTKDRLNKGIKCPDDALYTYASLLNGFLYKRCERYKIKLNLYNPNNISFSESNSQRIMILNEQYHNIIQNYIKNKYNITVEQLITKSLKTLNIKNK